MKDIKYNKVGDYYFPDLKMEESKPLTRYGRMYLKYLKEHKHPTYFKLLAEGKLNEHVAETDKQMNEMHEGLVKEYAKARGVDNLMKMKDQMKWVQEMNNIESCVKEEINKQFLGYYE